MWQLSYAALRANFSSNKVLKQPDLLRTLGWDELIGNPAYDNTCAIRMSLALIKSGKTIPGRLRIKKGPYQGKLIEMGQRNLSLLLAHQSRLGTPEKFSGRDVQDAIGNRNGIVSFWKLIPGLFENGHIDIVSAPAGGIRVCGSDCYWTSKEVWFWPLK
jgi:hypothetical protein